MLNQIKKLINIFKPTPILHIAFDSSGNSKVTIVLLHGVAATSNSWEPFIKQVDVNKYRVVAIDLLGFGRSPKPENIMYDIRDHLKSIHKTINRLNLKKPYILVGHSMGSIISARYCNDYQSEVAKAYLLSLPVYINDIKGQTIVARKQTDVYFKAYDFLMHNKKFTIMHSQNIRKLLRVSDGIDVNEENWNSFRLSLKNTIINQDSYNDVINSIVPIHIYYGALDEFLVQENVNKLAEYSHVNVTRISAVNHAVGMRFAKKVIEQIEIDNN